MDAADEIESRLSGDAVETKRRVDILRALVKAFEEGGEDAAEAALKLIMDPFKRRFGGAMEHVQEKL